ncbi:oxidoreductase [Methylorubrum rhodesianum]|jgi:NAD(P)-dependent dehydrogenase (short-subunit alcohol dehydrogenase family)|uniref:Oxidoreductase n=1 Tax=Methylorubrum rhodesianum TaxID=29427 RepID=A0ABU9ZGP8_9HYPH|nr:MULTISPECIES: oxidoreductase [Methylorubrum]MBY0143806.1 SDR family oxidoreductase [Methylorubrum populi]MRI56127.1 SDR family NAD(P)-dependent oxidoreductase [Methylobacterium sp. DB1607]MBB5765875.1 NAD(P)-dependent dehydrogenase (short-subunit alcohol dehydrogenase family) [Methylorubrum rhodesianum]MBI1692195.1 SDR family NAD(P)-dependent oxidoreductase [Methylorubrum sp. DB1722]MBK3404262.1 SDR family oxidoreductase [Methylorubrum rhodesianum]
MVRQRWTVADIPSQAGRRAVVTGASAGLGFETARALAGAGASVVLAVRDPEKGARAAAAIRREHPGAELSVRPIDTASLASVRAFARDWPAEATIDRLVLNAGIAAVPRREESVDGFERQLATNYLGHFALTGLLLPALSPSARVVSVASLAHRSGQIRFDDLHWRETYGAQAAYRQSKLALLMFALELDRRLKASGSGIASLAAHPGLALTEVFRRGDRAGAFQQGAGRVIFSLIGQPAAQGALPILYAAAAPEAERGGYYGPDGFWEARGFPKPASIAARALDRAAADRLWAMSETLTGVRFPL